MKARMKMKKSNFKMATALTLGACLFSQLTYAGEFPSQEEFDFASDVERKVTEENYCLSSISETECRYSVQDDIAFDSVTASIACRNEIVFSSPSGNDKGLAWVHTIAHSKSMWRLRGPVEAASRFLFNLLTLRLPEKIMIRSSVIEAAKIAFNRTKEVLSQLQINVQKCDQFESHEDTLIMDHLRELNEKESISGSEITEK